MAKKGNADGFDKVNAEGDVSPKETIQNLTDEHKKTLRWLMDEKAILADKSKQFKDDVKGFADKLGTNSKKINKVMAIIIQEEKEGGAVKEQDSAIIWAKQYMGTDQE